eukprot:403359760
MDKRQDGKDYFGFEGQAQCYAKYRPQYPKQFLHYLLDKETSLPNLQRNVCLDIATGTGFLVQHMASEEVGFRRVIGTDISDSQLQQAREKFKDTPQAEFHNTSIQQLPEFLDKHDLKGKVDLITIGQGLHWLPVDETLQTINSLLAEDQSQNFLVLAYSKPLIYDGSNWEQQVSTQNMQEKGYELDQTIPTDYKIQDSKIHAYQEISTAYEEMWTKIYPHFIFDRSVIEKFYTTFDFEAHLKVLKKVIWYDVTPNKTMHEVLGYMNSISAYQCYLEDHNIPKGSDQDPWVIFRNKCIEQGQILSQSDVQISAEEALSQTVDFITPYFGFVLGKKQ